LSMKARFFQSSGTGITASLIVFPFVRAWSRLG
jgi:hypothetical protein